MANAQLHDAPMFGALRAARKRSDSFVVIAAKEVGDEDYSLRISSKRP